MNKKFLGIKLSTYLTVICCAIAAVLCWLYVKYVESGATASPANPIALLWSLPWS